jgi:hypothetical protein
MEEIALSIDKTKHLSELGIEISKASMCWKENASSLIEQFKSGLCMGTDSMPVLTLQDMLNILPKSIMYPCNDDTYTCVLTIQTDHSSDNVFDLEMYYINEYYNDESERFNISKLGWIEATYQMILWLVENNDY